VNATAQRLHFNDFIPKFQAFENWNRFKVSGMPYIRTLNANRLPERSFFIGVFYKTSDILLSFEQH
jgi:hypothetical protein